VTLALVQGHRVVSRWRRLRALGVDVEAADRDGVVVRDGQRLQLSPLEDTVVRISAIMHGGVRVGVALILDQETVERSVLEKSLRALQAVHPALRCKVVVLGGGTAITRDAQLAFEVDDKLELPISYVIDSGSSTRPIQEAWLNAWSYMERVRVTWLPCGACCQEQRSQNACCCRTGVAGAAVSRRAACPRRRRARRQRVGRAGVRAARAVRALHLRRRVAGQPLQRAARTRRAVQRCA
jgi:hypothetical protein